MLLAAIYLNLMLPLLLIYLLLGILPNSRQRKRGLRLFLPFYPFSFLPLLLIYLLLGILPNSRQRKRGLRLFLPFYPFTFLPLLIVSLHVCNLLLQLLYLLFLQHTLILDRHYLDEVFHIVVPVVEHGAGELTACI